MNGAAVFYPSSHRRLSRRAWREAYRVARVNRLLGSVPHGPVNWCALCWANALRGPASIAEIHAAFDNTDYQLRAGAALVQVGRA